MATYLKSTLEIVLMKENLKSSLEIVSMKERKNVDLDDFVSSI